MAYSQELNIHVPLDNNKDTSLWYKWKGVLAQEIKLQKISNTTNIIYWRFWTDKQVIDLWITHEGKQEGQITSWVRESVPNGEEQTNRLFFRSNYLDSLQVYSIFRLIDSIKIQEIPDEKQVQNWKQGVDGITYIIESFKASEYFFKSYWTPTAQDTLKEAIIVQKFVDRTLEIIGANVIWKQFAKDIPFECYIHDGPICTCKILTIVQKHKYKKERKNYRQQRV
jgi:hypothetical protein